VSNFDTDKDYESFNQLKMENYQSEI